MQCAKCGSKKIMRGLRIVERGNSNFHFDLSIELDETPKAIFSKRVTKGPLCADICGDCGHVELAVSNPEELWEVYCRLNNENQT